MFGEEVELAQQHLRPAQLATRWGTTVGALATLRCRGLGPAFLRMGSRILYRLEDVKSYEEQSLVLPGDSVAA